MYRRTADVTEPDNSYSAVNISDDSAVKNTGIHISNNAVFTKAEGTPVVFMNLTYSVNSHTKRGEKVELLKNLNGCFSPGQMSALMGPSGSGKTTLLDVLAGRKTQGQISGDVLFSAQKPTKNFLRRFTGYVEQFDTLIGNLTVREMLLYTAELKRPISEPYSKKVEVVDKVIDVLGLGICQNTRIGSALSRGISGGQAKRTNIALAMVTNPRVLFLDEPTTGLDSYTSNEVMTVVKNLTSTGVTICATIHSPTPHTFALFDRLMVLVRGECVYHGPNGMEMMDYFRSGCGVTSGRSSSLRGITNDADFLTDLVVGSDRSQTYSQYSEAYRSSDLCKNMMAIVENNAKRNTMTITKEDKEAMEVKSATATPSWWALWVILKYRTARNYITAEYLGPRLGDKVVFAFLIGTLFWGVGDDFSADNILNICAVTFMWSCSPSFGAIAYLPAISLEKPLYIRERNDGLYRPITYLLSKLLDEAVITTFLSLVFSLFVWFVVQLQGSFLLFFCSYVVTLYSGILLAYFVAAMTPNMDVGNALMPMYAMTLLFFAGFLFRVDDIPDYWKWYTYIDIVRYGWSANMINQFTGAVDPSSGEAVKVAGIPVLEYYKHDDFEKWEAFGYICCFFAVLFILSWLALQFKKQANR